MRERDTVSRRDVVKAGVAAAGLATWTSFPAAAANAVEIASGTTITEPGEYALADDIVASRGSAAIDVAASGVTIDGQGHTVSNDRGECISVSRGANTVAVRNVRLSGARNGVAVAGDDVTVFNSLVESNGENGVAISGARRTRIDSCLVRENEQTGVSANESEETAVRSSLVSANGFEGIRLAGTSGVVVARCLLTGNGTRDERRGRGVTVGGDRPTEALRLADNRLLSNVAEGVSSRVGARAGDVRELSVVGNVVADNGRSAFDLGTVFGADVRTNAFVRNGSGVGANFEQSYIQQNCFVDDELGRRFSGSVVSRNVLVGSGLVDEFVSSSVSANLVVGAERGLGGVSERSSYVGNTIVGCDGDGVRFDESFENDFRLNRISSNGGHGVRFDQAVGNRLKFNVIQANGADGLRVFGFDNDDPGVGNVVRKNTIGVNGGAGIRLFDTVDGLVARNALCANTGGDIVPGGLATDTVVDNDRC